MTFLQKVTGIATHPKTVITLVGTVVGLGEALLYYNMGRNNGKVLPLKFPPMKEFLPTAGVVIVTSFITGLLADALIKSMYTQEEIAMAGISSYGGTISGPAVTGLNYKQEHKKAA